MKLNTGWMLQFLQNVCPIAAIVLCYREIIRAALSERQRMLLLGLSFGAGSALGTMLPVQKRPAQSEAALKQSGACCGLAFEGAGR